MVTRKRRQDAMRPNRYRTAVRSAGLVAALIALSGCENPYLQQFKEEFGWNEARMVSYGWLKGRDIPTEHTYCYQTLGTSDCYRVAKEGEEHRLITRTEQSVIDLMEEPK